MSQRPLAAFALLCALGLPAAAQTPTPAPTASQAEQDYLAELARVEAATAPQSLEPLLEKAEAVQGALMDIPADMGGEAVIERYSEPEFSALQARLRGIHLQRGMEIFVQPLPAFFSALAAAHGRPADQAYFALYQAYWGEQLFPVYMQPRALVVGCVKYGDGLLNRLYGDWLRYAKTYPEAYRASVQQMLKDFEEVFALGTCACGDRAGVVRELQQFSREHPRSPAAPAATQRWRELKAHTEKLPVSCG
ncbi:hypothetical protein ED208_00485 [Stagnimonas aquatica]|uniref:Uncharacterized protein n=1 Tax=Stagnimonas aquatica TaxID=2689987 RepID=A0A3N0VJX1_9GAMM|nr:hypothetical protein [Stagnimonas aquatica]ROH93049.1 hypothetical protein ED208_00485 [Stagnimonas aquatica]